MQPALARPPSSSLVLRHEPKPVIHDPQVDHPDFEVTQFQPVSVNK